MAVPYDLTTRWPTRNSHTTSVDSTHDHPSHADQKQASAILGMPRSPRA